MDRSNWLGIDHGVVAAAAASCNMFEAAFLYLEAAETASLTAARHRSSRRSSKFEPPYPQTLLLEIAKSVDEPDCFYGVENTPSLANIADRLLYEGSAIDADRKSVV